MQQDIGEGSPVPYEARSFADINNSYQNVWETLPQMSERGGITLEGIMMMFRGERNTKQDKMGQVRHFERSPSYSHQSSFTDEQRAINRRTRDLLTDIMEGKETKRIIMGITSGVPSLSERIVHHFQQQTDNPSYFKAISDGIVDCFKDLGRKYPSLLPSLFAMYSIGGTEGTQFATVKASDFLQRALDSELSQGNIEQFSLAESGGVMEFLEVHTQPTRDDIATYEVLCPGIRVAHAIFEQAARAAVEIADNPQQANRYSGEYLLNDVKAAQDIYESIPKTVEKLTVEAARRNGIEFTPRYPRWK